MVFDFLNNRSNTPRTSLRPQRRSHFSAAAWVCYVQHSEGPEDRRRREQRARANGCTAFFPPHGPNNPYYQPDAATLRRRARLARGYRSPYRGHGIEADEEYESGGGFGPANGSGGESGSGQQGGSEFQRVANVINHMHDDDVPRVGAYSSSDGFNGRHGVRRGRSDETDRFGGGSGRFDAFGHRVGVGLGPQARAAPPGGYGSMSRGFGKGGMDQRMEYGPRGGIGGGGRPTHGRFGEHEMGGGLGRRGGAHMPTGFGANAGMGPGNANGADSFGRPVSGYAGGPEGYAGSNQGGGVPAGRGWNGFVEGEIP
jgi:hypothetical protein